MNIKRVFLFLMILTTLFTCVYANGEKEEPSEKDREFLDEKIEKIKEYDSFDEDQLKLIVKYGDEYMEGEDCADYKKLAQAILDERDRIAKLREQIDEKRSELNKIYTSKGMAGIGQGKLDELSELEKQLVLELGKSNERKEKYASLSQNNLDGKDAAKGGDPVNLSGGNYEQYECDITIGKNTVFPFNITRRYDSSSVIVSSFGYGWSTNLDQRIILGIEPYAQESYNAKLKHAADINNQIKDLESKIKDNYQVSSTEKAEEEINARINECESIIDIAEILARQSGVESEGTSLLNSAKEKKQTLETVLTNLGNDLTSLNSLKTKYQEAVNEAQSYFDNVLTPTNDRKFINRFVMFTGMDQSYEETGLDTITIIDESGYPHILKQEEGSAGIWKSKSEKTIKECLKTADGYKVILKDGTVNEYDKDGFIKKINDRNQNYVTIGRSNDKKVTDITHSFGEKWKAEYKGNYIKSFVNITFTDVDESVIYDYRGKLLTSVTDTDGDTVTMEYDADGYLEKLCKCDGSEIKITYGLENNEHKKIATATTNEEKFSESFEYNGNTTTYTDHDGNKTVYEYDGRRRTVKEIRPDGTTIENLYVGDELRSVTENGNTVTYGYMNGNKTSAVYHDGSEEQWTYNDFDQIKTYRDRDGVVYEYIYDEKGNLKEYKSGNKTVYTQKVNEKGQITKRTVNGQNPVVTEYGYYIDGKLKTETTGGVKKEYFYDKLNRVTKVTVNEKSVSEYSYDGRNVMQKDYNGLETTYITNGRKDMTEVIQKDTVTGVVHKTRIEYDRRHLPLRTYIGNGQTETLAASYLYTPEGKLRAEVKHGAECWITLYEYKNGAIYQIKQFKANVNTAVPELVEGPLTEEILNELLQAAGQNVFVQTYVPKLLDNNCKRITITDGLGNQTIFNYDSYGNLVSQTDANGEVRSMTYKPSGRLETEQSSHGGWYKYGYENGMMTSAGEDGAETVETKYNPDGSIKSVEDRYGIVTYYNYDSSGRVSSVQSEAQKIWYEYDSLDRVTKQVIGNSSDQNSAVYYITYDYSDDGRTVTVTEGGKYMTVSRLDAFGNVISQTDGNGNTKRYEYDCHNLLVKAYDGYDNATCYEYNALGKVSQVVQPCGAETDYYYNGMGLLEKVIDECGTVYTASYDKAGRLVKERTRADSEKSYEYDKTGRVTAVLCGGEVTESYDYKNDSLTVTVTDGKGEKYIYNYDPYGRLINEINRKGLVLSYSYDAEGEPDGQTNFDGSTVTISYSRDRTVRTVHYSDGSENRFVYDAMGNIIQSSNAYGTTEYQYDKGGRLVYQKDVTIGEEIHFEYDGAGNRTRLYSTNRETVYTYGKNNEIKEIFDNKERVRVQLDYNINGQEVLRKYANGTREETLYDRAGRVTAKVQKNERGELLWGEGYAYGSDGKRSATVDNAGRVTLYEYNQKGQLSDVYYPYTNSHLEKLHEEAELNGLPANTDPGENRFLSSENYTQLTRVMNSMQYGLGGLLTNLQIFIKESYAYDGNGNRVSKTTGYGKIEYAYDKENCLVSSGSRGQTYVTYTYDSAGNLLTEESAMKSTKYAYNAQNRLIYCEVTDRSTRKYSQSTYAYDAMGRRVLVQDIDQSALRTLYDGFTFEVIKQSPTFVNGLFTDSLETGIRWGSSGKPTGERYRYIGDEDKQDNNRYIYLDENSCKTTSSRYQGERTQITVNGTLAAQSNSEGSQYFTTDLFGSVATVFDSYGYKLEEYTYDVFGSLVQGDLSGTTDFGYLGKQNDSTSKLYNYGYRDYKPESARFTTVDPIRDGTNWFAYVNNDPVNHIDLWGLCQGKDASLDIAGIEEIDNPWKTWWNKKDGEELTEEEIKIQKGLGIAEMIVGPVGGGALSMLDPAAFLAGMYLMADGAIVYTSAEDGIKMTPITSIPTTFLVPYVEVNGIILPAGGTFIW